MEGTDTRKEEEDGGRKYVGGQIGDRSPARTVEKAREDID